MPTGGILFSEINLRFTTKEYKNGNIPNFVYLWENSIPKIECVVQVQSTFRK